MKIRHSKLIFVEICAMVKKLFTVWSYITWKNLTWKCYLTQAQSYSREYDEKYNQLGPFRVEKKAKVLIAIVRWLKFLFLTIPLSYIWNAFIQEPFKRSWLQRWTVFRTFICYSSIIYRWTHRFHANPNASFSRSISTTNYFSRLNLLW